MAKNKLIALPTAVIILSMLLISYIASFYLNAFNQDFYKEEFQKHNIYGKFQNKDIDSINAEILLYIRGKEDSFNKELFKQSEISHLKDVRTLIKKARLCLIFAIIALISSIGFLFILCKKRFPKILSISIFLSGAFILAVTAIILLSSTMGFDGFFIVFHKLFFPQGNWLFSSSDSLIRIYPSEFFYDIAKKIFTSIIIYGNILIGVGIISIYLKK